MSKPGSSIGYQELDTVQEAEKQIIFSRYLSQYEQFCELFALVEMLFFWGVGVLQIKFKCKLLKASAESVSQDSF